MIDPEILAKEAKRLKDDVFLQEAIRRISASAMNKLVAADPANPHEIIAQQVRIKFCSEVFSELESMINSGQAKKPRTVI
jgi:hypothetical protein